MSLSQFTSFAPVINRLSDMRPQGQRGQQALGAPSYQEVPEDMLGSCQLGGQ